MLLRFYAAEWLTGAEWCCLKKFLLQEDKGSQGMLVLKSHHGPAEMARAGLDPEAGLEQSALAPQGVSVSCCLSELIKWDFVPFPKLALLNECRVTW